MNKEFYDKYGKKLDCKSCIGLQECSTNSNIPLCDKGYIRFAKDKMADLETELAEKDKEINSLIVDYEKRISQEQELMSNLEKQLAELKEKDNYHLRYELAGADETITNLKKQLEEKDKEIEDLKKWQDWYSMWHKEFQKQIEDLTTELETYRPTKLHGNGQCKCFNCNAINWTDWCSSYKGHTYCDDCLKEILKEEQTPQTKLAIQELEKVNGILTDTIIEVTQDEFDLNKLCYLE